MSFSNNHWKPLKGERFITLGPGNYTMVHLGPHSKVVVEGARKSAHKPGVEGGEALGF